MCGGGGEDPDRGRAARESGSSRSGRSRRATAEAAEVVFKVRLRAEDSPPVPNQAELSVSSFGMHEAETSAKKASLKLAIQGGWGPRGLNTERSSGGGGARRKTPLGAYPHVKV